MRDLGGGRGKWGGGGACDDALGVAAEDGVDLVCPAAARSRIRLIVRKRCCFGSDGSGPHRLLYMMRLPFAVPIASSFPCRIVDIILCNQYAYLICDGSESYQGNCQNRMMLGENVPDSIESRLGPWRWFLRCWICCSLLASMRMQLEFSLAGRIDSYRVNESHKIRAELPCCRTASLSPSESQSRFKTFKRCYESALLSIVTTLTPKKTWPPAERRISSTTLP